MTRYQLIRAGLAVAAIAGMPLILWSCNSLLVPQVDNVGNLEIAIYLREHTPEVWAVADTYAGIVPYFSHRPAIDLLGKSDWHIAHLSAASSSNTPGHNKFDFDYSLNERRPQIVVASFHLPVTEAAMQAKSKGEGDFIGQLYLNRYFQADCLEHPAPVETWRTLFYCDWPAP